MSEKYTPGTHLLLTLQVEKRDYLIDMTKFVQFVESRLFQYQLNKVGLSTHIFDGGGFTAAFCLMESHICVHTWPEFNQLTLDVYLCNYLRDNSSMVLALGEDFKNYFQAKVLNETLVNR